MTDIEKNTELDNDNHSSKYLNDQNKFIILGWVLSSILIYSTAWFVITNTQKKIFESYHDFGVMLAKTFAIESVDLTSQQPEPEKVQILKEHSNSILKNNNEISLITFRDAHGNVLYSTKSFDPEKKQKIVVTTPMVIEKDGSTLTVGSVELGLTGNSMRSVGKTTRNSMIIIFTVAWIVTIFAVLINTRLLTRQITILVDGVRRISSGEFGYRLTSRDLWGEIKELFEAFNNMSVRLRQYEDKNIDEMTYERNKLEAVLMSIANGVVVCDNFDKIVLVNNAALRMLDMKAQEAMQAKIQNYCDTNGKLCFKDLIDQFKETPLDEIELKPLELQVDIDNRVIKTIVSPLFSLSQEYLGYIIILHDVTKEAEIDKMKSCFISNVSHELRTPVTVLRTYIDTLHNYSGEFDEATKAEFIGIMNQEAERLNKMVNDILDFSRLESPNVELEKRFADIRPILELTVSSMKVLAEERNITISVMVEPELPKIYMNTDSIERVIKNLLSNAIKYSEDGGRIKIRAELDRSGQNIEVSVEDNGMGIDEENLKKIFDRFYRVENSTHTIKGTGLGLHLVQIAIEKHHNGKVFVESEIDKGSMFGFRLPLIEQEEIDSNESEESAIVEPTPVKPKVTVAKKDDAPTEFIKEDTDGWELTLETKPVSESES